MPDADGVLTQEEQNTIKEWITRHWPEGVKRLCPSCQKGPWTIQRYMGKLLIATPGEFRIGGPAFPKVVIVCQNCAYTELYNAIVMGLEDVDTQKEEPDAAE